MKTIAFIVPYFGKLPGKGFELWLLSCRKNPTVDWLIYTDDRTNYDYPPNVKVRYCTLEEIRHKAQKCFDFQISLERPRKLCDFKAAYGEIFEEDLKGYDYWGYCDVDLVWGNLRKFITDDILEKYEKIGFQGHCLLYKNTKEVVTRYKSELENVLSYKKVYSDPGEFCFDEDGMDSIYQALNIPYWREIVFAHLRKYEYGFSLAFLPKEDAYKNEHQIFTWEDGKVLRHYVSKNRVFTEEFMYIHFFCRPMKFILGDVKSNRKYIMYADAVKELKEPLSVEYIMKHSRNSALHYYASSIWYNRKKLTPKRIFQNIKRMLKYRIK